MRAGALLAVCVASGCGAKTGVIDDPFDGGPPPPDAGPECADDADCSDGVFCNGEERCIGGECIEGIRERCADGDVCTRDACDADLDQCVQVDLRVDGDGDGFYPESCGPDCDDEDALVYPGAPERCNGKDDDCDGIVDEDLLYTPTRVETRITDSDAFDNAGGLAWTDDHWVAAHYPQSDPSVFMTLIDDAGLPMGDDVDISLHPGDAFAASLAWSGNVLGAAWEDRRDGDYEIYFQRLNAQAEKLQEDLRITFAFDFSLYPVIQWSGEEFGIVWQDSRFQDVEPDNDEVFFQRVSEDGDAIGLEIQVTDSAEESSGPDLAWGDGGWGVVSTELVDADPNFPNYEIFFQRIGADGTLDGARVRLTDDPGESTDANVVWADGEWGVVWEEDLGTCAGASTGRQGTCFARLDADGTLIEERRVDDGSSFARFASIAWTGSNYLIVWSDWRNGLSELYYVALDRDGATVLADTRITEAGGESFGAGLAKGEGEYGILWTDYRDGNGEVYFTALTCEGAPVTD